MPNLVWKIWARTIYPKKASRKSTVHKDAEETPASAPSTTGVQSRNRKSILSRTTTYPALTEYHDKTGCILYDDLDSDDYWYGILFTTYRRRLRQVKRLPNGDWLWRAEVLVLGRFHTWTPAIVHIDSRKLLVVQSNIKRVVMIIPILEVKTEIPADSCWADDSDNFRLWINSQTFSFDTSSLKTSSSIEIKLKTNQQRCQIRQVISQFRNLSRFTVQLNV